MDASSTLTEALLAAGTLAIFLCAVAWGLYRIVQWARLRRKRGYVVCAMMFPFIALGNVSDPDFRVVQEAKRLKNRDEDDSGDPPEPEDEGSAPPSQRTQATGRARVRDKARKG